MKEGNVAFVAVGGNQPVGDLTLVQTIRAAIGRIPAEGVELVNESSLYLTPCFPAGAGPDYVNAALELRVPQSRNALWLLDLLHRIEAELGRLRQIRWGARTVDLDLLAFGDVVAPDVATWSHWSALSPDLQATETPNQLILPHPRMQDRAFVLVPLAEIAADWVHPVLKKSVSAMLAELPDADLRAVRRL